MHTIRYDKGVFRNTIAIISALCHPNISLHQRSRIHGGLKVTHGVLPRTAIACSINLYIVFWTISDNR